MSFEGSRAELDDRIVSFGETHGETATFILISSLSK